METLKLFCSSLYHPSVHSATSRRNSDHGARCKISCYKDFQGYAKPLRLLPVSEPKHRISPEQAGTPYFDLDESCSLVKVKLQTSNMYGSCMSDANSAIIVCLIDEDGDSILQRIPLILEPANDQNETVFFQRGSTDEFMFLSPNIKGVEALWLGVESGQWRVSDATVTMVNPKSLSGLKYEFKPDDDTLIGEGADRSLLELKPLNIFKVEGADSQPESLVPNDTISREEGMREYSNLKLSLLCYDAALIAMGTLSSLSLGGGSAACPFLLGGASGFAYLLLIQKSVDNLPATQSHPNSRNNLLPNIALTFALLFLVAKLNSDSFLNVPKLPYSPAGVVTGMMGFLVSKLAVFLAAYAPLPMKKNDSQIEEDEQL